MRKNDYIDCNDYELLYMIHQEDEQAFAILIEKYDSAIYYQIKRFKKKGIYALEDYYQIALLKLVQAVYSYREDKEASFLYYYTELLRHCFIDHFRHIFSYDGFQEANSISLDMEIREDGMYNSVKDLLRTPERREYRFLELVEHIKECETYLNTMEIKILKLRFLGYTYRQIAEKMSINEKKVDNTIRKIRNKKTNKS